MIVLYDSLSKIVIMEVGVIEVVIEKFVIFVFNVCEVSLLLLLDDIVFCVVL